MDHIFISIKGSCNNPENALCKEIALIRTNGSLGTIRKNHVLAAYTAKDEPFSAIVSGIQLNVLNERFSEKYVVVSLLPEITKQILRNEYKKYVLDEPFYGRTWVSIHDLAWPLIVNGMIKTRSVEDLAKYLGIAHSFDDCADFCTVLANIYGNLMRRYKTALIGEEGIREAGGETLENIRQMIGF